MIAAAYEARSLAPQWVFDPVDVYAEARAVAGPHPRPSGPIAFDLIGEMVLGQRQEYPRPIRLAVVFNPTGYGVFLHHVLDSAGDDGGGNGGGRRRRLELAPGTYIVRASGAGYQSLERDDIAFPQTHPVPGPYLFALEPGYDYAFPKGSTLGAGLGPTLLRGSLLDRDGSGIAGAEIVVPGQSSTYRSGTTGQWVLVFPDTQPAGNVTVRFRLPQAGGGLGPPIQVAGVALAQGVESSFLQAALAGRVTTAGAPTAGARVRVLGLPGQTVSGNDGGWSYYFPVGPFPSPVDVEARHPDGTLQNRLNVPVAAGKTTPVEIFSF